ncbi:MAG TPA: hypothetical protein VNW46_00120 [Gemmatimonadaceae bacterium]|nr:hypothetical protein [Gemmatimonadaceae bacterium]
MTELHERDAMVCRRCGKEDRASEGYPCAQCGTFLCIICSFRGYTLCAACEQKLNPQQPAGGTSV